MFCDIILVGFIISGQARNGLHGLVTPGSHCGVPLPACTLHSESSFPFLFPEFEFTLGKA